MQFNSWTCLMAKNGPGIIAEDVRNSLAITACEMHHDKSSRAKIRSRACDGFLQTDWKTQMIGARGGILFRAHVQDDSGGYQVNFLLSTDDLDSGADALREYYENSSPWRGRIGKVPLEQFYEFEDKIAARRKLN